MPKSLAVAILPLLLAAALAAQPPAPPAEPAVCDRACLEGFVNQYLDALVAHNAFGLPLAPKVKFTENDEALDLGDGLWNTASGPGTYKLYVSDPQSGQVGFFGTLRENGTPIALALRLKIDNRRISEIETVVLRANGPTNLGGATNLEQMGKPDAVFSETVPPAQRLSRDALIKAANNYFEAIEKGDGALGNFDKDCNRIENGVQTTNNPSRPPSNPANNWNPSALGCAEQLNTKVFNYIQRIYPRRFLVVDEERQLVFGSFMFQHPGNILSVEAPGHGIWRMPETATSPSFVDVAELFRIKDGKIRKIEALMVRLPYGTPNPFFGEDWRRP